MQRASASLIPLKSILNCLNTFACKPKLVLLVKEYGNSVFMTEVSFETCAEYVGWNSNSRVHLSAFGIVLDAAIDEDVKVDPVQ